MKTIGSVKEDLNIEKRISITPDIVKKYKSLGFSINLENAYPIQVSQVDLGEGVDGILEVTVTWEYDNWKTDERNNDRSTLSSWFPPLREQVDIEQGFI